VNLSVEERRRVEVAEAYTAAVRLRLYSPLTIFGGVVAVVAIFGGMVVGWLDVGRGMPLLIASALVPVGLGAKLYDQSFRTEISAAGLERSMDPDEDLYAHVSAGRERLKALSVIAAVISAVGIAFILSYSISNEGTERDDDDDRGEVDDDRGEDNNDGGGDDSNESEGDDD
jgi:hypothetical protein